VIFPALVHTAPTRNAGAVSRSIRCLLQLSGAAAAAAHLQSLTSTSRLTRGLS